MTQADILQAAATILAGSHRTPYPEMDIKKAVDEAIELALEIQKRIK